MHRTLIVARLEPGRAGAVAEAFAESDATELPRMLGVKRRTLFRFHDLYFHLIESDGDLTEKLDKVRDHPLYQEINQRLARYVRPYDPNWREPKDAMAEPFYAWPSSPQPSP